MDTEYVCLFYTQDHLQHMYLLCFNFRQTYFSFEEPVEGDPFGTSIIQIDISCVTPISTKWYRNKGWAEFKGAQSQGLLLAPSFIYYQNPCMTFQVQTPRFSIKICLRCLCFIRTFSIIRGSYIRNYSFHVAPGGKL